MSHGEAEHRVIIGNDVFHRIRAFENYASLTSDYGSLRPRLGLRLLSVGAISQSAAHSLLQHGCGRDGAEARQDKLYRVGASQRRGYKGLAARHLGSLDVLHIAVRVERIDEHREQRF